MKKLFSKVLIALAVVAVAGGIYTSQAKADREEYMGLCTEAPDGTCMFPGGNECYCASW